MSFSYTGLAFLLGFFAVGLLAYRFFQYWQKEKTVTAKIFFCFAGVFALTMLIAAIAGLLFALNSQILKGAMLLTIFVQNIGLAIGGFLIIHLKFPKISPWWGFLIVFLLGLVAFILSIPSNPYLEASGSINWNVQLLPGMLRAFMFLIIFLPLIVILIQQIRNSQSPLIKKKALGLSLVLFLGIVSVFATFLLDKVLGLGAISPDIVMGLLGIIGVIFVLQTQKPPQKEQATYSYPSERIKW